MAVILLVNISSNEEDENTIDISVHHKISEDMTEFENEAGEYILNKIKDVISGFSASILLTGGSYTPLKMIDEEDESE